MKTAAILMAKVFAVVFGAGSAAVALLYLLLGGCYFYVRIERMNQVSQSAKPFLPDSSEFVVECNPKGQTFPKGFVPNKIIHDLDTG